MEILIMGDPGSMGPMRAAALRAILISVFLSLLLACDGPVSEESVTADNCLETGSTPVFMNVSEAAGLSGVRGDSYAWGDWNRDGYQDLLVKGGRLFRNNGPPGWDFTEVTENVGLNNSGYAVWGDLDSDGYLDIFSVGHPYENGDTVWLNRGPPLFELVDVSHRSGPGGVDDGRPGLACGLGDYDRDGDLDVYVVNWRDDDNVKYEDVLWRNDGNGVFTDVTDEAGIVDWNEDRGEPNAGMGVNWGDYNNDGWIDIYVSNYLITPNYLWENQGDGTFVDVGIEKGCAGEQSRTPQETYYGHTAASQWADYDNDGDLDLWCSNLAHKDPYRTLICADSELLRNDGPSDGFGFTNVRDETGIPTNVLGNEELFFGIAWGDYDNDGDLDMWIPQIKSYIDYAYSYLFRNNGDGSFTDVSDEAGFRVWNSDGGAWCDYDNDGDLDLITEGKYPYENGTYDTRLYRNMGTGGNHFLEVDLVGAGSDPSPVGARVTALDPDSGDLLAMREVEGGTAGHSYGPSYVQEFGFGSRTGPVDLEIRWPGGRHQYCSRVGLDRIMTVEESSFTDLCIDKAVLDPPGPLENEEAILEVRVYNTGDSDIREAVLRVSSSGGMAVSSPPRDIGPITTGSFVMESFTIMPEQPGTHSLTCELSSIYPMDDDPSNDVYILDVGVSSTNRDPVVESLSAEPDVLGPGESSVITAVAEDPDGDPLLYEFSCGVGRFLADPDVPGRAVWSLPADYPITGSEYLSIHVDVSDGRGGRAHDELVVQVVECSSPPMITGYSLHPEKPPADGLTDLTLVVSVSHDRGPEEIYLVQADLSGLGGSSRAALSDGGSRGDEIPDDGNYTVTLRIPKRTEPGWKAVNVTALDHDGNVAWLLIDVEVMAGPAEEPGSAGFDTDLIIYPGLVLLVSAALIYIVVRNIGRGGRGRRE